MAKVRSQFRHPHAGFTLVEIIVGIVVLAVALTLVTSLIVPAARQSVSPVYQVRAAELGQAMLNEIMGKSFDQQNDRQGVRQRCEPELGTCTPVENFGGSGFSRDEFVSVEQYHGLDRIESALGTDLSARYPNYSLSVAVCYADQFGACQPNQTTLKRILVTVLTPDQQAFEFSALRGNF